jgi:deoxyribonucleoside regulator
MLKQEKINLMISVAKLYYENDYNQNMIAEKLNLSRPYVSKLLNLAKEQGLVTVEVHVPDEYESPLEAELRTRFNLKKVIIVPSDNNDNLLSQVGAQAARYLNSIIKNDDIICVSWGKTLYEFSLKLTPRTDLKNISVVQGCGGISQISKNIYASEIPKKIADAYGGVPYILPLPAIVDRKMTRDLIMQERNINQIMNLSREANIAIFPAGYLDYDCAMARAGYISTEDVDELIKKGACGDIFIHQINSKGEICDSELDQRSIAIELDEIKKKEYRIAIACGSNRVCSLHGAIVSGVCNVLVTDEATAKDLMSF